MLNTYYTYRALAYDWNTLLEGETVSSIYSSRKKELTVELTSGSGVVFGVRGSFRYFFRSERSGRPRRNVASLMTDACGARIRSVRVVERDRVVSVDLGGELELRYFLFGSRPNVVLMRGDEVIDAFKAAQRYVGKHSPPSRPADRSDDEVEFLSRAQRAATAVKAVTAGFPLFDRVLATEVLFRGGVSLGASVEEALESAGRLYEKALDVERELEASRAGRIYVGKDGEPTLSLIELEHLAAGEMTAFHDVDSAVNACTRLVLRSMQYQKEIGPVRSAVDDRLQRVQRRLREATEHLGRPGRADELEHLGHLLMTAGRADEAGLDAIEIPDHFADCTPVRIVLDPSRSVMDNAQEYYDRARRSRLSRQSAQKRLDEARGELEILQRMSSELEQVVDIDALREFRKSHNEFLVRTAGGSESAARPFRRYSLEGGYEVWVGRNARENEELTFGHARKFDIWMHARGVGGSHVVLRLPGRRSKPAASILEAAAGVAAYFSKARGSEFAPVMYTERKYVRKPRGADTGKVIVDRENVLIVRPKLPPA